MVEYYTPELSEFHVGFIFEAFNTASNYPKKDEWVKFEMGLGLGEQWNRIEDYINNKQIRVKYLDKSDIESLGFKFNSYDICCKTQVQDSDGEFKMMSKMHFTKEGKYSDHHITCMVLQDGSIEYQKLGLHIGDIKGESPNSGYREGGVEGIIVSGIYIKNKSELKVLLKQLGINE